MYGSAISRLASVGVISSAALRTVGAAACGLPAATRVNGANSAPMAAAYSSRVCLSRARRAFSASAYWLCEVGEAVRGQMRRDQAAQPVAAVLEAALGVLAEVWPVGGPGITLDGGNGLGAEDEHHVAAAGGDRARELVD